MWRTLTRLDAQGPAASWIVEAAVDDSYWRKAGVIDPAAQKFPNDLSAHLRDAGRASFHF